MSPAVVLFRRDLRLADNPALTDACLNHGSILPVYIHAPSEQGSWPEGAASRWWLHHSLDSLQGQLRERGGSLHLCEGDTLQVLLRVLRQSGARGVYWNRLYDPTSVVRDARIKAALREQGFEVRSHAATLWLEPWKIRTQQGGPYRIFTPFWHNLSAQLNATPRLPVPTAHAWSQLPGSQPLTTLELLPRIRWDRGLAETWQPGEKGAHRMLKRFCDDAIHEYAFARDLPARNGTSRLSAHLHFGEISPQQIHVELQRRVHDVDARRRPDIEPYLRQLGWREFSHHLLYHFPQTTDANFNPRFNTFAWREDEEQLARWQKGRTGIPLVDAGMRELWHTGWMHNRVRMIVASFLTKNLRQHWLHGARWFWDTLVDADLANNTLGWQWAAGCGADAAPYFRVFNPVAQARKSDPVGVYLRRWLPELASLPLDLLYEPWKDPSVLAHTGYPAPVVDLAASRQNALEAYEAVRER
jgi:deoxyribodipyrimidine photo-lyase